MVKLLKYGESKTRQKQKMKSMTGYGRSEYSAEGINLIVELKTVNNRNFDFNAKMPRAFISLEEEIRKTVSSYVIRGRVDLFVNFVDRRENKNPIQVDIGKAKEYYQALKLISTEFNLPFDVSSTFILKSPDVIVEDIKNDAEELKEAIIQTVKEACKNLNQMRLAEGEKLIKDLLSRMETIEELREKIKERAPLVAQEHKKKLAERITEALNDVKMDEVRLLNEVAFYTDRVNIDEELTRLGSHISQFKSIIKTAGSGKKLDFLMQEFNREANTICSKSNDIEVTNYGLLLKNEIEKVREQVQNLE